MLHVFQRFPAVGFIYLRPSFGSSQITNSDIYFFQLAVVIRYLGAGVEVTISQKAISIRTLALKASICSI